MPDGVRLSATLYMPDNAKPGEKFPALLEYLPYRKDDATAARDYPIHSYFAARGYVSARVDIRGFGASEGVPTDREYSQQEQLDCEQVIAWLASQTWSNGKVGMFGISWGGFNSIQMAMRHPPALKAILAVDATDALFHDDIHYVDGLMHFDEFELNMDLAPAMTGAPDYTLDDKVLGPRFESAPWSLLYLKHQRDGDFWHAPVHPLSDIKIPCFLIGGLLDGYRDSIPHMFEQVKAPLKAIIGPWNHNFPNDADFGPRIEWRDEAVRWWDYWLKNRNSGIMDGGALAIYMRSWHAPDPQLKEVPGTWRTEPKWPPEGISDSTLYLYDGHALATDPAKPGENVLRYVPSIGVEAGFWWGELLPDQRPTDAFSLTYDSAPLNEELTLMGRPHAILRAIAGGLVRAPFRRCSRRHGHAGDGRRVERRAARFCFRPKGPRTQQGLRARHRDALYDMDFPERPSHPAGGFECFVADGVADSVCDDDHAAAWHEQWFAPRAAAGAAFEVCPAAVFRARTDGRTQGHAGRRFPLARRMEDRARRVSREDKSNLEWEIGRDLSVGKGNGS